MMSFKLTGKFIKKKECGSKLTPSGKYKDGIVGDEIFHSGNKIHKPLQIKVISDYILRIEYDDGKIIYFDMKELLNVPLFKPLKEKSIFENAKINGSSISWENDIDLCADSIYNSKFGHGDPS